MTHHPQMHRKVLNEFTKLGHTVMTSRPGLLRDETHGNPDDQLVELLMAEAKESLPRLMDCLQRAVIRLGETKQEPELEQMLDDAIRDCTVLRDASYEWGC